MADSVKTELLAPAGDWDALRAAVAAGADAVYFGLSNFNARHRATNFTLDELPAVIEFLHQYGVRGYVTCNTLVFSDELAEIARFIAAISSAGADAVIVQDWGLARLIRRLAPELPIHGSTQMTLADPRSIEAVRRLGVERVILARELSLDDIAQVREQTDMPVEVFVHGAMCVAYSGQCLTSEALGGRSANRGQCAQACRLPYELIVDGVERDLGEVAYLLSPQDLDAHDLVGELVKLGVASLKIEGRLKSASYVTVATSTYRGALDAALAERPFELSRQGKLDLAQSFSRGFAPGFLGGIDHQRLVHGRFSKARGVRVATVVARSAGAIDVALDAEHSLDILRPGDGVVFDQGRDADEQGGRIYQVRPLGESDGRQRLRLAFGHDALNGSAIAVGSIVWKTDDPELRRRAERAAAQLPPKRREPIDLELEGELGGPLRLVGRTASGRETRAAWDGPLELARKHPLDEATAREQLGRLGDTNFELRQLMLRLPAAMVPKSVLNNLRRQVTEALAQQSQETQAVRPLNQAALDELRRAAASRSADQKDAAIAMHVLVRSLAQLEAVLAWQAPTGAAGLSLVYCDFEDVRRYRDAVARARAHGAAIGLATLRVAKPGEEGFLRQIARCQPDAVLVRNLAALDWFAAEAPETKLVGDSSLNAANELSADWLLGCGLERLVPSYDLNWDQLVAMLGRVDPGWFEIVVHQHMPMFHMEHCVFAATLSQGKDWRDCGRPCDRHRVELRDRVGAQFPLVADTGCRNTLYNAVPQSAAELVPRMLARGLKHFRLELLREKAEECHALLERYSRVLAGLDEGRKAWRGLQVLNQLGVTRGTFGRD